MTPTLIRRLGKGYCAAGEGFYYFDEDLSRVLQRVAEFNAGGAAERTKADAAGAEPETTSEA